MIVELRRYTLHPGRRDELIELFEREFVESQEELGMAVLGRFRDLDRPDMFVWLRGFADMEVRGRGLREFYGGPVWKEHGPAANATMIDSDDVLLLRTIDSSSVKAIKADQKATIWYRDRPFDEAFAEWFAGQNTGAECVLWTEYAENNFPALPVRAGEHAFVWFQAQGAEDVEVPERFGVRKTERLRLALTGGSRDLRV
ncbi:NIPSNAP family protein [Actinoplanes sp. NPDC051861]|uniref:NIPSNAP family protein n=1 Tax=Actinoplanes sp. NPDC051861 TaxID=3155170 RepID=UPI003424ADA8